MDLAEPRVVLAVAAVLPGVDLSAAGEGYRPLKRAAFPDDQNGVFVLVQVDGDFVAHGAAFFVQEGGKFFGGGVAFAE
ncbi:MAG: hypothetical protein DRQ48_00105 [Gammaproteobacteria bacterium]|nr:MAG: hypothetical protein DRQ48_00105 [Gammaproteobacteria bacterium]